MHPAPSWKTFDTSKGLDGLLVIPSDLATRLEGWPLPLLVMDFETNGSSAPRDDIVEIAAIRIEAHREVMFSTVLRTEHPGRTDLHGISAEDQERAPCFADVVPVLRLMAEGCTLVSHHTTLDRFVAEEMGRLGGVWSPPYIDSLKVVRAVFPERKGSGTNTLYRLCNDFGIPNLGYHLAMGDAIAVAHLCAALTTSKPAEVQAAIQKVMKRRDGGTTWPDRPLPDQLVVAVRFPQATQGVEAPPAQAASEPRSPAPAPSAARPSAHTEPIAPRPRAGASRPALNPGLVMLGILCFFVIFWMISDLLGG